MSASISFGHAVAYALARFVPVPDSCTAAIAASLDHLVGNSHHDRRNGEAEGLRGLEVDDKLVRG